MVRSFRWRWVGSLAVAGLVLTVSIASSPPEAQAGCDHPWVARTTPSHRLGDLAILDPVPGSPAPETGLPRSPGPRIPCLGGACSPAPHLPMGSTDPIPARIELWGDLPSGLRPWIPPSA